MHIEDVDRVTGMILIAYSIPEVYDLGGIEISPEATTPGPCSCYGNICFKKGIMGALSKSERDNYCTVVESKSSPAMEHRLKEWTEAKNVCKAKIDKLPKGEKLVPYIECMGRELPKRGIEV